MKRAIVAPATLAPAALAELKEWLGVTNSSEDASLTALLRGALETCEAFTGTMPLTAGCEEVLPVSADWQAIATRPIIAMTGVAGIDHAGTRLALASSAYAFEFRADGTGWVRMLDPGLAERIAVSFTAGLAGAWSALPDGLRHGVIRLAAHNYRLRESGEAGQMPPAAVAALWRPWRGLRLL
jgi:uncharacterized phiE125 gp8 family phage protein